MTSPEVRSAFLRFFEERGHRRLASSSLVPANDPSLLFTNAGMVQFKDVFTGREARDYRRATTSQKCVRAGGKHNDLDNVGFTARHHTFFEMLGNFSFGDYFKEEAIRWGLELVAGVLRLPLERLAVTVFAGEDGIPPDDEAARLWEAAGMPASRIQRLGKADNFWAMGDTGPCGPCSEIYVYQPKGPPPPGDLPGASENWLEIWNLVFMQFEKKTKDGPLEPLPRPSIDTGSGLERVAAVVQGKASNYDTDLFAPLLRRVERLSGGTYGGSFTSPADASMRVIADHARATAFLVADGVQPSNEGRGYVLRRIMRRAIRHGEDTLGLSSAFFHEAVEAVVEAMGQDYPELREARGFVLEVARQEEQLFRRTLTQGRKRLAEEFGALRRGAQGQVTGATVWDLHQTYGFPWDLTEVIAKENGFSIDRGGFERLLEEEQERSRGQLNDSAQVGQAYLTLAGQHPPTEFLGYQGTQGKGSVLALLVEGRPVQQAGAGQQVEVLLDRTPFYGESGGQVGDTGVLEGGGARVQVEDAQRPVATHVLHRGKVLAGTLRVGAPVEATVDAERRRRIMANHSATHLLHRALRLVVGEQVTQKGSIVHPDYLRFDFSSYQALTLEQLERVEDLVNQWIRDNEAAGTRLMPLDEARAAGAMALFGEKYGEVVRVVSVHHESTELCGGTHVERSGDIGLFKLTEESSIASGVRRVVALTGARALQHVREEEKQLKAAAELFRATPDELPRRIEAQQRKVKELEKKLEEARLKASQGAGAAQEVVEEHGGVKLLWTLVAEAEPELLKKLADRYKDQLQSGVVALGGTTADGRALVLVAATKDVVARGFKAGEAIKRMAEVLGGKGGGKPDLAQAGGADPSKLPEALGALKALLAAAG